VIGNTVPALIYFDAISGVFMSADRYRGLQLQIEGQAESIRELEADIAAKVEEIRVVTQLCERKSAELAESVEAHGLTKVQLSGVERDLEGTKVKLQVTMLQPRLVNAPRLMRLPGHENRAG
jgi:hypothetical protein